MTTFPRGRRTSLGFSSFEHLTEVPVARIDKNAVEFASDLEPSEADDVSAFLDATDDADQARRAQLRDDRDALDEEDPLRRLYDYVLGD